MPAKESREKSCACAWCRDVVLVNVPSHITALFELFYVYIKHFIEIHKTIWITACLTVSNLRGYGFTGVLFFGARSRTCAHRGLHYAADASHSVVGRFALLSSTAQLPVVQSTVYSHRR